MVCLNFRWSAFGRLLMSYIPCCSTYSTYYMSKCEIFYEPKESEMSRNIPCEASVISDLSYTDGKYTCELEH